jgi:hypothetical protein
MKTFGSRTLGLILIILFKEIKPRIIQANLKKRMLPAFMEMGGVGSNAT